MSTLKLFLFGPPRVELAGIPIDLQRRKALALLIYLAISDRPHSRDALAALFWPDHTQSQARAYLRRDLAVLNTSLAGEWLAIDREMIELKRGPELWVDVLEFSRLLAACRSHNHPPTSVCSDCLPLLIQAVNLYPDGFLAGFTLRDSAEFDDWQFFQTERLRQELAMALERLVRGLSAQNENEAVIPHARRWVALDPLHEPAQRALMHAYDYAGQPAAALRQYEEYVDLLDKELSLPPGEETTTLYEAIKAKRILGPFIKAKTLPPKNGTAKIKSKSSVIVTKEAGLPPHPSISLYDLPASSTSVPFVGRERESAQLIEMLKSIAAGAGRMVLIEGEPGIGKSRLVEEVVRIAQHQGIAVLLSKCYEVEQRMPYQTVIDLVDQALFGCPSQTFQHLPSSTLAELTLLVPEIKQVFPNLPTLPTGLDEARQARLFRALQQFLTAPAGEKGLILVIDDLHWTDEVTLQFLSYLARHIVNRPVLLIGTCRSEEAAANEQLSSYLHTLLQEPHSAHLALNRLSLEDTSTLVASLPTPTSQAVELGQWLYRQTEGNPLFLISILQSLQEQGVLQEDDSIWQINLQRLKAATSELTLPEALREAVRNRLRRISKRARAMLEIAAVYGRRFDLPVLSAITAENELSLLDMVEDLTTHQLLRENEDDHYDFFHDKIREVTYYDLSMTRRRLLHRRVAEALEALGNHQPGTLAEHFEKGQTWDKAITYLAQAAEQARKLFAMPEALRFYDRAIALAEEHPDAIDWIVVLDLHEQRGKARGLIGGMADEAIADLTLVLEAARAAGEQAKERDLLISMGQVYRQVDQYDSALYYLEEGLKLARQSGDQQSVVNALYHLGTVVWSQGYNDQALVYHQEAVDICRQLSLTNLVAVQALHGLGEARWLSGDAKGGIELYEESLNLARQIQDKSYECENLDNIGYASQGLHGVADYQRAEEILKEGLEISRAAHLDWHFVIALAHLALNDASKGDFQQAITAINQSIALTEAIGAKRLQSTYTWARGFIFQELNLFEQAKADCSQAIVLAQQTHAGDWLPRLQADFSISQLRLGNLEVELELQAALANALRHKIEIHATRCLEGLAELALAKGEPHQALNYAEQLWQLAERHDLREIMARALRWRGVALLALEQFEAAATTLQQALELAEVYGRIRLVWQLHAALARLYRAQGQAEKAVDHDTQVQKIIRQIAANLQAPELRAGLPLK